VTYHEFQSKKEANDSKLCFTSCTYFSEAMLAVHHYGCRLVFAPLFPTTCLQVTIQSQNLGKMFLSSYSTTARFIDNVGRSKLILH